MPYAQATRTQLVLRYSLGPTYFDYMQETLNGKTSESLVNRALVAAADVRLFRGLSLSLFGRFSYVRDQIYLARAELSPEEIFLELCERQSALYNRNRFVLAMLPGVGQLESAWAENTDPCARASLSSGGRWDVY